MTSHYKQYITVSRQDLVEFMGKHVLNEAAADALMSIFGLKQIKRIDIDTLTTAQIEEMRGKGWYIVRGRWMTRPDIPRQAIPPQTTLLALTKSLGISERTAIHALRAYGYHDCQGVWSQEKNAAHVSSARSSGVLLSKKLIKKDKFMTWKGTLAQAQVHFGVKSKRALSYALTHIYGKPTMYDNVLMWNTNSIDERRAIYNQKRGV